MSSQDYQNYAQNLGAISNALLSGMNQIVNTYNRQINETYNNELNRVYRSGIEEQKRKSLDAISVRQQIIQEFREKLDHTSLSSEERTKIEDVIQKNQTELERATKQLQFAEQTIKEDAFRLTRREQEYERLQTIRENVQDEYYISKYKGKDGTDRIGQIYTREEFEGLEEKEKSRLERSKDTAFFEQELNKKINDLSILSEAYHTKVDSAELSDYHSFSQVYDDQVRFGFKDKMDAMRVIQSMEQLGAFVVGTTEKVNGQYVVMTSTQYTEQAKQCAEKYKLELQAYEEYHIERTRDIHESIGYGFENPLEQGIATSEAGNSQRQINTAFSYLQELAKPHDKSKGEVRADAYNLIQRDAERYAQIKKREKNKDEVEFELFDEKELETLSEITGIDLTKGERVDFIDAKTTLLKKYEKVIPINARGKIDLDGLKALSKTELQSIGMTEAERKYLLHTMATKEKTKGQMLSRMIRAIARKSDLDYQWVADMHHAIQRMGQIKKVALSTKRMAEIPIRRVKAKHFDEKLVNDDFFNEKTMRNHTDWSKEKEKEKKEKKHYFQEHRRKKDAFKDKLYDRFSKTIVGRAHKKVLDASDKVRNWLGNTAPMRFMKWKNEMKMKFFKWITKLSAGLIGSGIQLTVVLYVFMAVVSILIIPFVAIAGTSGAVEDMIMGGENDGGLSVGSGALSETDIALIVDAVGKHYYGDSRNDENNTDWIERKKAITLALQNVGLGTYCQNCHGHAYLWAGTGCTCHTYKGKEIGTCNGYHTDCSGFVSYIYLCSNRINTVLATTTLAPNGTPRFQGVFGLGGYGSDWNNVKPADAVVYHGGTANGGTSEYPAHALLYIGLIDEDITLSTGDVLKKGEPITVDCTSGRKNGAIQIAQKKNLGQNHKKSPVYIRDFYTP